MSRQKARILVVEDSRADRMLLTALLRRQGYSVIEAADGPAAIAQFEAARPDLVLLDVIMPGMDGIEVARVICDAARRRFVPIIFLTALQEPAALARCLDAGGVDFLTKPYHDIILKAKLGVFLRMAEMQRQLQRQRDEIARHNERLLQEQEVAKVVYDKVAHHGDLDLPHIRYLQSPLALFNGDVLLAARGPTGNLLVLLGDFTGHGLAAAIGAMPLAQTFYAMAEKGFRLRDIIRELNLKLHAVLPPGVFCCATAIDFDSNESALHYWSGGLPEGVMYRVADGARLRLRSRHLPLGIRPPEQFDDRCERIVLTPGDRLLLWSDGILEAANAAGERYGEARLLALIGQEAPLSWFDALLRDVEAFAGTGDRGDDVSLLEITVPDPRELEPALVAAARGGSAEPQQWQLSFTLLPASLRSLNPLPLLLHILMEVPGLRPYSSRLFTALSELYANALEHGLLRLDSSLKSTGAGFSQYYAERDRRLAQLEEGSVVLQLAYEGDCRGGLLEVELQDSGAGFDAITTRHRITALAGSTAYAGRGIRLLERLGFELTYFPPGNRVRLRFPWGEWPAPFTTRTESN